MNDFFAGFPFVIPELHKASASSEFDDHTIDLLGQPLEVITSKDGLLDEAVALLESGAPLHLSSSSPRLVENEFDREITVPESLDGLSDISSLEGEDPWTSASIHLASREQDRLYSWDGFYNAKRSPNFASLGDACPLIFDAALSWSSQKREKSLETGCLLNSLIQLGLGRDSLLYAYDHQQMKFGAVIRDACMSGHSSEAFYSVVALLMDTGCTLRKLRSETSPSAKRDDVPPASMAVFCEVHMALALIEESVVQSAHNIVSLLQVESLFEPYREILDVFMGLLPSISGSSSDVDVITRIFNFVVKSGDHRSPNIQAILRAILQTCAGTWISSVTTWLRLTPGDYADVLKTPSFVSRCSEARSETVKQTALLDWDFLPEGLTPLMTLDEGRSAFETGYLLELLSSYCSDHPILTLPFSRRNQIPKFKWGVSWSDIEGSVIEGKTYENELSGLCKAFENSMDTLRATNSTPTEFEVSCPTLAESIPEIECNIEFSLASIETPMYDGEAPWFGLLHGSFNDMSVLPGSKFNYGPPLSMAPSLSIRPWISAQHRLANRACLWLVLKRNDLRSHLALLHRFQLLSDGPFSTRLGHALFSPDLPSSERNPHKHRIGFSGLRLGHRATWPPASSELRLALTGLLKDSYFTKAQSVAISPFNQDLPGNLNFAIRELSEAEIKKCLDPNSVSALDFLCLQYRAPAPLDTIITPAILSKYDAIFRLLLRAKRMQYVVDHFDSQISPSKDGYSYGIWLKLRHVSRHFISSINQYFSTSITKGYASLIEKLSLIEKGLSSGPAIFTDSLFEFRDYHAEVLDRIRQALFLSRRYGEVYKLVEDIFEIILKAAKISQETTPSSDEVKGVSISLHQKISIFARVCRGLEENNGCTAAEKCGPTTFSGGQYYHSTDESAIGELLLTLDMNDFFK